MIDAGTQTVNGQTRVFLRREKQTQIAIALKGPQGEQLQSKERKQSNGLLPWYKGRSHIVRLRASLERQQAARQKFELAEMNESVWGHRWMRGERRRE